MKYAVVTGGTSGMGFGVAKMLVNKGYYVFVRIEKLRSNNEYAIIKSNTPDGLRQYDHIALNASDAVDQALIY